MKCLVSWDAVCRPKEEGGLGVKSLSSKNECLQLKLIHQLYSNASAPWPRWVWAARDEHLHLSPHWKRLDALLPLYRAISSSTIGEGCQTSFCLDCWLPGGPLCQQLAALFSHALDSKATVASVLGRGVRLSLVPRLNTSGDRQMATLSALLGEVVLS